MNMYLFVDLHSCWLKKKHIEKYDFYSQIDKLNNPGILHPGDNINSCLSHRTIFLEMWAIFVLGGCCLMLSNFTFEYIYICINKYIYIYIYMRSGMRRQRVSCDDLEAARFNRSTIMERSPIITIWHLHAYSGLHLVYRPRWRHCCNRFAY